MNGTFQISVDYIKYSLDFRFDAVTSRGILRRKDSFFVSVASRTFPGVKGYGEAGPLPQLSEDYSEDIERWLSEIGERLSRVSWPGHEEEILALIKELVPQNLPSVRFAFETALLDLLHGGQRQILKNEFFDEGTPLSINGLIWMGDKDYMLQQIEQKLEEGYNCIKMKIGGIDFEEEYSLLSFIRNHFSADEITLRVDANGAFSAEEALFKLQRLAEFDLHSIEQPIRAGQGQALYKLCRDSPIPVALDEELIGIHSPEEKARLLETIQPHFIVLKPSLVGGILASREWISIAEKMGIGWWLTSALESNIGLNAIAQLASSFRPGLPQGLGTGQLYHNNIEAPLKVRNGKLFYDQTQKWGEMEGLFKSPPSPA